MKKIVVQVNHQRFELGSSSREEEKLILQTAKELTEKIEILRRDFPDSSRATVLAALLVVLEAKNIHNTGNDEVSQTSAQLIKWMREQIDATLARTRNGSPAKANT